MEHLARVYKFGSPLRLVPAVVTVRDSRPLMGDVQHLVAERVSQLRLREDSPFPSEIAAGKAQYRLDRRKNFRNSRIANGPDFEPEVA